MDTVRTAKISYVPLGLVYEYEVIAIGICLPLWLSEAYKWKAPRLRVRVRHSMDLQEASEAN